MSTLIRPVPPHRTTALALVFALAVSSFALPGCRQRGGSPEPGGALQVVTTVGMLADAAERIGGDCAEVRSLMGPGVDPHLYRASANDLEVLGRADLILYGGMLLEGKMVDVLDRMQARTTTVPVLEHAPEDALLSLEGSAGHHDPHLWNAPDLWARVVPSITDALADARPDCADAIRQRGDQYVAQIEALDAWAREAMGTIPEGQRVLVTAHDAFAYFGRAYELEVRGIQGVSTESEASVADIREVAELVATRRVPALFVESSVNPRNIEAVRAAVASRGWEVSLGPPLYSDAMGESGTWEGTYLGMLQANVRHVVEGLGGTPPPLPASITPEGSPWPTQ